MTREENEFGTEQAPGRVERPGEGRRADEFETEVTDRSHLHFVRPTEPNSSTRAVTNIKRHNTPAHMSSDPRPHPWQNSSPLSTSSPWVTRVTLTVILLSLAERAGKLSRVKPRQYGLHT